MMQIIDKKIADVNREQRKFGDNENLIICINTPSYEKQLCISLLAICCREKRQGTRTNPLLGSEERTSVHDSQHLTFQITSHCGLKQTSYTNIIY